MLVSIINKAQFSKYDCGFFILSPDFYQADKIAAWDMLHDKSLHPCSHYFHHIKHLVTSIEENATCYDLTDGLPKFFDGGTEVDSIISAKKIGAAGDFAIARMRSYLEEMGMVEDKNQLQLFSSEFLMFRAKTTEISTRTLFALCMTEHVQTILKRGQYGTGHPRFYDFLLTNLPIPDFLIGMDRDVSNAIAHAVNIRNKAKDIYAETQNLLLAELGLSDWRPKHRLTYVKNYSAVKQAKRFDADYFQPKYDEIVNAIKNYSGGCDTLGNLTHMKKCVEVGSEEYLNDGIPFVRVSNINPFDITRDKYISNELYHELDAHQPMQGEILLTKDATPGNAYYLNERLQKMILSSGILRLSIKSPKVNGEYLTLVLNSILTKEQINRDVGGSIILHWRPDQAKSMLIPILDDGLQAKIQQKVAESFALRKHSKHLLECAKRAVEIAIEQDEKTALNWLKTATSDTAN